MPKNLTLRDVYRALDRGLPRSKTLMVASAGLVGITGIVALFLCFAVIFRGQGWIVPTLIALLANAACITLLSLAYARHLKHLLDRSAGRVTRLENVTTELKYWQSRLLDSMVRQEGRR